MKDAVVMAIPIIILIAVVVSLVIQVEHLQDQIKESRQQTINAQALTEDFRKEAYGALSLAKRWERIANDFERAYQQMKEANERWERIAGIKEKQ